MIILQNSNAIEKLKMPQKNEKHKQMPWGMTDSIIKSN